VGPLLCTCVTRGHEQPNLEVSRRAPFDAARDYLVPSWIASLVWPGAEGTTRDRIDEVDGAREHDSMSLLVQFAERGLVRFSGYETATMQFYEGAT
jgi:hypothetical protein